MALAAVPISSCSDDSEPVAPDGSSPLDAASMEAGADSAPRDLAPPDGPVTVKPDGPVTVKPDGPVTVKPDGPVTFKPDLPVTPVPDMKFKWIECAIPPPDGPTTPAPDGPVTPTPDGPVTPAPDALPDGPPIPQLDYSSGSCNKHCDCPQGQACMLGGCTSIGAPIYCCSKTPCPAGSQCVDAAGSWKTCSGATTGCKTHCDCNQGEACQAGKCLKTTIPTYCCSKTPCPASTLCYNANGSASFCPGGSTGCKTHCDCSQGETCLGGNCTNLVVSYCCTKAGCPSGKGCYQTSGTKSYCP